MKNNLFIRLVIIYITILLAQFFHSLSICICWFLLIKTNKPILNREEDLAKWQSLKKDCTNKIKANFTVKKQRVSRFLLAIKTPDPVTEKENLKKISDFLIEIGAAYICIPVGLYDFLDGLDEKSKTRLSDLMPNQDDSFFDVFSAIEWIPDFIMIKVLGIK